MASATRCSSDRNWAVRVTGFGLERVIFTGGQEECELVRANQEAINMGFRIEVIYHQ